MTYDIYDIYAPGRIVEMTKRVPYPLAKSLQLSWTSVNW